MALTPIQEDFFRTLERMDISPRLRRSIAVTKAEMCAENEAKAEQSFVAARLSE